MNFIAIFVAGLIPMVLGFIWYHPKVLGTVWMKESGMTEEKTKQGNLALKLGLSLLFSLLLSMVLSSLVVHDAFIDGAVYYEAKKSAGGQLSVETTQWVDYYKTNLAADNHTAQHGSFHALVLIGILIILPVFATNALFEAKSFRYVAVNVAYWLLCVSLMGGLLAAWR
ncbi:MAG: DUF1761 domain-containing protein [Bacteroidia bacterium]